ncbi:hypothetical protein HH310_14035 [Actinoplanes sp. TBRC 11911]|uniref:NPCBM/NEW2 domain-containing protein n=1 Tax=Actinoplanes sp. TBRC 11911 TaxID=2729386 RepID=UPI00145C58D9|nr:NPCBM/NEW2 domain-containing protein [Actinoplanes sp. TBRC 11911]NMO52313.1 hypothetical protein [Actinoplanes sp. TBRC 11911]
MSPPPVADEKPGVSGVDRVALLGVVAALLGIVVSLVAWLVPDGAAPTGSPGVGTTGAVGAPPGTGTVVRLGELPRVNTDNPFVTVGSASLGGRAFPESITLQIVDAAGSAYAEFDVGGQFRELTATLGMSDTAVAKTAQFVISGDGKSLVTVTARPGASRAVKLDLAGVSRLRVTVSVFPGGAAPCCASGVVGSPVLRG